MMRTVTGASPLAEGAILTLARSDRYGRPLDGERIEVTVGAGGVWTHDLEPTDADTRYVMVGVNPATMFGVDSGDTPVSVTHSSTGQMHRAIPTYLDADDPALGANATRAIDLLGAGCADPSLESRRVVCRESALMQGVDDPDGCRVDQLIGA